MINLAHLLESTARRCPERVAIVCGERRLNYAALDGAATRLAAGLARRGIGPGDIVALACANVPEFAVVYFAVLKAGATVLPVSLLLKADEIAYMLAHSEAAALFCLSTRGGAIDVEARAAFERTETCRLFVRISTGPGDAFDDGGIGDDALSIEDVAAEDVDFDTVNRAADDTAVVVYTSGTTGRPKGAELTHANLMIHALMIRNTGAWGDDEVLLVALPLFHIFGQVCQMAAGLSGGARLVLMPKFDPARAIDLIAEEGVTRFSGVPTMFWTMMTHAEAAGLSGQELASLRQTSCGGASMPVDLLTRFNARFGTDISEGYGLSETSPAVTTHHPGWPRKAGSVGTPVWGVQVRVVDEDDRPLPTGQRGEVVVRGHSVMKGYLKDPEATATAFRGGWFHTGDIGLFDEDGYLFIVDRKKEMIIRNGMNVYPREVEEVLITHPDISLVAVIGVPDREHGQEVKAVAVRRPAGTVDADGLIAWARDRMGAHKYPRIVEFRDALPMTATGKILKKELG